MKDKRLLLLGGTNNAPDIKKYADLKGIELVVTSKMPNEKLEAICAESYSVDCVDKEGLIKLVKEKDIDGIFCGGNEKIIQTAIGVCEEAGLPFYSSSSLWSVTSNKRKFKDLCKVHGVPIINEYFLNESGIKGLDKEVNYPVIVKPVDNCGSAGFSLCNNDIELENAYRKALQFSEKKQVIVEDYILGDEIVVYYTFSDGKVTMSSMNDKYLHEGIDSVMPLSDVYFYPSRYLAQYEAEIDKNMREMLLSMGIKNGIVSVQGFYYKGQFMFFEIGYRLGGTSQHRYTDAVNGVNSLEMLMAYSLTGKMVGFSNEKETPYFDKKCCTFSLLSTGGTVNEIIGIDLLEEVPEIIAIERRYDVGDSIAVTNTVAQIHLRFFIVADTIDDVKRVVNYIHQVANVYDVDGNSMLDKNFDVDKLDMNK